MISTIPYILKKNADQFGDKEIIISARGNLTCRQLYAGACRFAAFLKQAGASRGDRLGILMNKSPDNVITVLGTLMANVAFIPIGCKLKEVNISHIIGNSGMKYLVTDNANLNTAALFADRVQVIVVSADAPDSVYPVYNPAAQEPGEPVFPFNCISSDMAALIYSSGSTGRPKGIIITHYNFYHGAEIVTHYLKTEKEDRIACVLDFTSDYALNQLWQALLTGASLYLHDFMFPNDMFNFLWKNRITALPVMPMVLHRIYDSRFLKWNLQWDFSHLRYICTTGAPVSAKLIARTKEYFPGTKLVIMFGLTEAFRSTYLPPEELERRPGSIGKAIPDAEIYVLDDDLNVCAPGVSGELVHRGGVITKGYWQDEESTKQRFREIPCFKGEKVVFSGDLVKTDEEGFIYFLGRKDLMIKTSGFRVSPAEIEEEVQKLDGIENCVAFGIADEEQGQCIVLTYITSSIDPGFVNDLKNKLLKILPHYMLPKHYHALQEFPLTGNGGKVDRVKVKELTLQVLQPRL